MIDQPVLEGRRKTIDAVGLLPKDLPLPGQFELAGQKPKACVENPQPTYQQLVDQSLLAVEQPAIDGLYQPEVVVQLVNSPTEEPPTVGPGWILGYHAKRVQ